MRDVSKAKEESLTENPDQFRAVRRQPLQELKLDIGLITHLKQKFKHNLRKAELINRRRTLAMKRTTEKSNIRTGERNVTSPSGLEKEVVEEMKNRDKLWKLSRVERDDYVGRLTRKKRKTLTEAKRTEQERVQEVDKPKAVIGTKWDRKRRSLK